MQKILKRMLALLYFMGSLAILIFAVTTPFYLAFEEYSLTICIIDWVLAFITIATQKECLEYFTEDL